MVLRNLLGRVLENKEDGKILVEHPLVQSFIVFKLLQFKISERQCGPNFIQDKISYRAIESWFLLSRSPDKCLAYAYNALSTLDNINFNHIAAKPIAQNYLPKIFVFLRGLALYPLVEDLDEELFWVLHVGKYPEEVAVCCFADSAL